MKRYPATFDEWKKATLQDPEATALKLLHRIEAMAPKTRHAVISHLPDSQTLIDHFRNAARNPDLPLAGIPFLLKDLFDVPGFSTSASSTFLNRVRPRPSAKSPTYASTRAQGGVFAGKTHLNEFAYGLSGENPHFGDCPHPKFPDRLSGGSSSGSAWAVASGLVPLAFGTDTGGSIRVPAAWCGLYGLRLSPNEWSQQGCFPLAPSLDTAGWFCRSSGDMRIAIKALLGTKEYSSGKQLKGLSLIDESDKRLSSYKRKIKKISNALGARQDANATCAYLRATLNCAHHFSVLQSREALSVHNKWIDVHKNEYDPEVWQRIARARDWSPEDVAEATQSEARIQNFFAKTFKAFDFILLPATWTPAPTAQEHTNAFRSELLSLTAPGSLARCPILTVPVDKAKKGSIGIQVLFKETHSDLPLRILNKLKAYTA